MGEIQNQAFQLSFNASLPDAYDPFSSLLPDRTPGSLGRNDAGDPNVCALHGDTPRSLGTKEKGWTDEVFSWLAGGNVTVAGTGWVRPNLRGLKPMGQAKSTLCWLTCYQMLYIWKGLDPKTIEGKLRGAAGVDYDGACNRGLYDAEIPNAAKALGLVAVGDASGFNAVGLKSYLGLGPLWIAGEWFRQGKHVRLLVGASDTHVEFFDPWYGLVDGGSADSHTDIVDNFLHGDRHLARGMDGMRGTSQLNYWRS